MISPLNDWCSRHGLSPYEKNEFLINSSFILSLSHIRRQRKRCWNRVNRLPPLIRPSRPRRRLRRPSYFLSTSSGSLLNYGLHQIYDHNNKNASAWYDYGPNAPFRLIYFYNNYTPSPITPCFSRGNNYATNRPKHKNYILRPNRRRRPYIISTPLLILRPPRGIHSYPPRIWYNITRRYKAYR